MNNAPLMTQELQAEEDLPANNKHLQEKTEPKTKVNDMGRESKR